MALLLGCKPPKNAPSLKFADYRLEAAPAHPAAVDYLATLDNWQMLGNDSKGDCVAVTWANTRRLVSATLTGKVDYPGITSVLQFYATQNPNGSDNGMDIQTALEDLVSAGGPDGVKAVGFAAVDYTNAEEVQAAIDIFGSVWTGVNVQQNNQSEFAAGEPWDFTPGADNIGGHSIITGGYGNTSTDAQLSGDEKFITWAQETSFTDAFWSNQVTQTWVVIWPEHLGSKEFVAGMDLATFAADYQEITGATFPGRP